MAITASYSSQCAHPRTNGKCLQCGSESHNLQACARPRRQQSSRSSSAKPAHESPMPSPRDEQLMPRLPVTKGKSKGKGRQTKPAAKSGDVDFDENAQAEQPQEQDEDQEDDPEAYCVEAQSTSESEMDSDGMLDWSASKCKDYKDCIATVACASPTHSANLVIRGNGVDLVV